MENLIQDLKTKLQGLNIFNWVAVWNNQFQRLLEDTSYAINNPSAYIEIVTADFHQLGEGRQGIDIVMNIHIISMELDEGNGDIDSHISIYGLRDTVVKSFAIYEAHMGGFMIKTTETQDYNHTNLYHYIIQYKMHYIDDTAKFVYQYTTPPTDASINKTPNT